MRGLWSAVLVICLLLTVGCASQPRQVYEKASPGTAAGDPTEMHTRVRDLIKQGKLNDARILLEAGLANRPQDAVAHFLMGVVQFNGEQYHAAINSYRRAVELQPGYAEAHNNLGNAHRQLNQVQPALESYQKAIELDPKLVQAYTNLFSVLVAEQREDEATKVLERAVRAIPGHVELRIIMAQRYNSLGRRADARAQAEEALKLDPNNAAARNLVSELR